MSRQQQWIAGSILGLFQTIGEPLADHFQWSNTIQILFHAVLAYVTVQMATYAQQFNTDGSKPGTVLVTTEATPSGGKTPASRELAPTEKATTVTVEEKTAKE